MRYELIDSQALQRMCWLIWRVFRGHLPTTARIAFISLIFLSTNRTFCASWPKSTALGGLLHPGELSEFHLQHRWFLPAGASAQLWRQFDFGRIRQIARDNLRGLL